MMKYNIRMVLIWEAYQGNGKRREGCAGSGRRSAGSG
jgi:hypothetical protein